MLKKILIIDDDRINITLLLLRFGLRDHFEVLTALDGLEGLEVVRSNKPDLIVLDIQMPRMSGYEFMNEIKLIPGGVDIPIIVLTANDNMQDEFFSGGVKGYFVKPVDLVNLEGKIRMVLGLPPFERSSS